MLITTYDELAAAIREVCDDWPRMQIDPDDVAKQLYRQHTFGGQLRDRRGKTTATLGSLQLAVAMFFEKIGDDGDSYEYRERLDRAQDLLDAVDAVDEATFDLEDLQALRPLDRQRFLNLFLNASDNLIGKLADLREQAVRFAGEDSEDDDDVAEITEEDDTEEPAEQPSKAATP
jgi:hypothetical protein